MKKLSFVLVLGALIVASCGPKKLSKEEASSLIRNERGYPKLVDFDVFCGDPQQAWDVIDKGLEEKGFVIVHRTAKLKDIGKKPIIDFTGKATRYLLPTTKEDKEAMIQKVKIADEYLAEIISIVSDKDGKIAVVEFTTTFENITPFSGLSKIDFKKPKKKHKATFVLSDDNSWILQQNQ